MSRISQHKHFAILTLGCRVNQCESDSLAQELKEGGWADGGGDSPPELVIVNTCAVTGKAAMQSRQAIRKIRREHPEARIVVTGCYAQIEPGDIRKIDGVDTVCGNADKHRIPGWVAGESPVRQAKGAISVSELPLRFDPIRLPIGSGRTRPVLKIQDGCDAFCTYCIVPYARGRSRSMPPDEVIANIRMLTEAGYREVVLSGIHLGCYGLDLDPCTSLEILLDLIEEKTAVDRVRLSSIEPRELTPGIIERITGSTRFCRHVHIPLQSGSDAILEKMKRPYTAGFFEDLVLSVKETIPDAAVGCDVLVGFPGETDREFEATYRLIERLPVSYLHVFPFSPRKGTPAAKMPDPVDPAVIKDRCARLRKLGSQKRGRFYRAFKGQRLEVLIEGKRDPESGCLKGLSSNYIPVLLEGPDEMKNELLQVRITEAVKDMHLKGELLNEPNASKSSAGTRSGVRHDDL